MKLEAGTEVYIKVLIVRRARDECQEEDRGYLCETKRGGRVFVNPPDILISLAGVEIQEATDEILH